MGKILLTIVLLLGGCVSEKPAPTMKLEFREVGDSLRVNYKIMVTKDGKSSYPVSNEVLMSGEYVSEASILKNESGTYGVSITLNSEGTKKFQELTKKLVGKKLAAIIEGDLIIAPKIMEEISGGRFIISGSFTKEEAEKIARGLAPQN